MVSTGTQGFFDCRDWTSNNFKDCSLCKTPTNIVDWYYIRFAYQPYYGRYKTKLVNPVCGECIDALLEMDFLNEEPKPDILDEVTKSEVGLKRSNPNKTDWSENSQDLVKDYKEGRKQKL